MLESLIVKATTDPGLRVREGGERATLKSGELGPVFSVPRINAEVAYPPPAIPMRRTRSRV